MSEMPKTPLAVFTYNRPEHTRNMLQSLAACARLEECDIFIYCDAPRISEHAQKVAEVRALVRPWGAGHGAKIIERGENLGLARSIVDGVTELCAQYGRVIVVEDDLVLHPAFIHYMLSALDRYESDDCVAQISGYMFPVENLGIYDAFFLPFTSTWGWGTWQRVWKDVDWRAESVHALLKDKKMSAKFDLEDSYQYSEMLRDRLKGKNQSWGILFYGWIFASDLLVLHPRRTFIYNSGMDGSGYHSSGKTRGYELKEEFVAQKNIQIFDFPAQTVTDWRAYQRIKRYIAGLKPSPLRAWYGSIKQSLKNFFRKHV